MGSSCTECGQELSAPAAPAIDGPLATSEKNSRCPRCQKERRFKSLAFTGFQVLSWLFLVGLALSFVPSWSPGAFLLNLGLFFLFVPILVILHEAAHALCGTVLGLRVFRIRIGRGPLLLQARRCRTQLELRVWMDSGATLLGHPDIRHYRRNKFLTVLAGPSVHVAFLLAFLLVDMPPAWARSFEWLQPGLLPGPIFAGANLLVLLVSLFPQEGDDYEGPWVSDSLQLSSIPWLPQAVVEQAHALYFALEASTCLQRGQHSRAVEWCERGLQQYPGDETNALLLGSALIQAGDYGRARQHLVALLNRPGLSPSLQALAADAVVTALLERIAAEPEAPGAADLLTEAEHYMERAENHSAALKPQNRLSLQATRGCLLVEQGKMDEGATLLVKTLQEWKELSGWPFCLCYLALAAARGGQVQEGRKYLEMARRLDPECRALKRADRELTQASREA